jgi:Tfp pilus assembly protein PilV
MARGARHRARGDDGFGLVEVVVACFVLLVGMLGVLTVLDGSVRMTASNNQQVAATNLARELVEATRGLDYDDMASTTTQARLQADGFGSGTPWTIERSGVTYTVTATSCTYDDPADKLAATPPAGVCTPQPAGSSGDANGDDFRRTTFGVAWTGSAGPRSVTQTTLVVNPSGGLGPRVLSLSPVTQTITSNVTSASVSWTTTPAEVLRWVVDDGASGGSVVGATSFTSSWGIGSSGSGTEVLDGSYQLTAQPFDDLGVAGEARRANVVLNRRQPYAPPSLVGGHDTRLNDWVEFEWTANRERDVLGYRVIWAGANLVYGDFDDVQVCPTVAEGPLLGPATTTCVDRSPPVGATRYYVVALDRDPANALRAGDRRTLAIAAPGPRPHAPISLAVVTVGGQPLLTWLPPLLGGASFYRIYRDGDRYDRTSAGALTYTDSSPGSGGHSYWVTAVDSAFNESDVVGPLVWAP